MTPEEREQQWNTTTEIVRQVRAEVIEECAQVADGFGDKYYFMSAVDIAAAIRALKDKP